MLIQTLCVCVHNTNDWAEIKNILGLLKSVKYAVKLKTEDGCGSDERRSLQGCLDDQFV